MLAVRDKDSGKIEVYDTDVFHMKPYWPGIIVFFYNFTIIIISINATTYGEH